MTDQNTAAAHKAAAAKHLQAEQESYERSDTDGALSQFASRINWRKEMLAAEIADNGGKWTFSALFDLEGRLISAKRFEGQWGWTWGMLPDDNPQSKFNKYLNESNAKSDNTFIKNMAKKGYYVGKVMAPARAELGGGGTGMGGITSVQAYAKRTDGGFSRDVDIVDNGQIKLRELGIV